MSEEKISAGVQSLEVGLAVLNALLEHNQPIILKQLSQKLAMHPAKVHRYLVSLIRMNYAQQLEDGQYALGDQAWRLGLNCIQHTDRLQLVQHLIYALQAQVGCGIQICKWSPQGPVVVQSIESNQAISIVTKVGSVMPLLNSAAGRLFASYMPEAVIKPMMQSEWQQAKQQNRAIIPRDWDAFLAMKQQIILQKQAVVRGDLLVGINAVGFPILNSQQGIEYCLTALDNESFLALDQDCEKLRLLQQGMQRINQFILN